MRYSATSSMDRVATFVLVGLLLLSLGVACTASSPGRSDCEGQRLIVTTAPGLDVAASELDAIFTQEAGTPLRFMRTLFENYHLFCVEGVADASGLQLVKERLIRSPEVQGIEVDRMREPQARYP